jgi:hypothetical protein
LDKLHYTNLLIEYANPQDLNDSAVIPFQLENKPIVPKWIDKVLQAQSQYPIDDPARFYGFGSREYQQQDALTRINSCIGVINSHRRIIDRNLSNINDQDTLNYLHHIFEVYHGLLDNQTHEFYISAGPEVRLALANLNLFVHRCESVGRGANPRHVVTWFGLPKTDTLDIGDYKYFTNNYQFGTVYLNYVEIGKTLEDLAQDGDKYIGDDAFQPFRHYSADFNVKFFNTPYTKNQSTQKKILQYYQQHRDFFEKQGLSQGHDFLRPGSIPLAKISNPADFELIESRQYVKSVTFE